MPDSPIRACYPGSGPRSAGVAANADGKFKQTVQSKQSTGSSNIGRKSARKRAARPAASRRASGSAGLEYAEYGLASRRRRSKSRHAPGFAAGRRSGARSPDITPARTVRAVPGVRQDVGRRLRRRAALCAARHRRKAPMDDGGRVQRDLRAVPFSAGAEHRQLHHGVRIALSRASRRHRRISGTARPARRHHGDPGGALSAFRPGRCVAAYFGRRVLRGGRPADLGRVPDDDAADQKDATWSRLRCWLRCSSRSECCGCRCRRYCWWRSRSASPSPSPCAGGLRHEFRQSDLDAAHGPSG